MQILPVTAQSLPVTTQSVQRFEPLIDSDYEDRATSAEGFDGFGPRNHGRQRRSQP